MKAFAVALFLFGASTAGAQISSDPTGHWKGTIAIPNQPVDFEVDVARDTTGRLVGTALAAPENAPIPLLEISVSGATVTFFARNDQPFKGEVSSDGKAISGTATLSGYALPFELRRTGDAKVGPPPTSRAVDKDLEGRWTGALAGPTRELHFVIHIENRPDGTAVARQSSLDEGGLTLYLLVAQDGRKVKIEAPAVAASFEGELNAAATDISGTWKQRGLSLPITMTRSTKEESR